MSVRTRLGTLGLVIYQMGKSPGDGTLCCPQCKTKVARDSGCLAGFAIFQSDSTEEKIVKLLVECQNCGCNGKEPILVR
jgi:hypothetical protein